jgi:hypothetical protein
MIGEKLGGYAHYLGRLFGSGDYTMSNGFIKRNSLVMSDTAPTFGTSNDGSHCMRGYICDIVSSGTAGAFQIQQFPINVGMAATFAWPSSLCSDTYQQYEIEGLTFEYLPNSSDYAAGTTLGYIAMATDYDSTDSPFKSKQQMENTEFAVSCKPSKPALHAIECARGETTISTLYVRSGSPPNNSDLRMWDLGQFYIASGGVTATNTMLGELWYTIKFRLKKPILRNPANSVPYASYSLSTTAILGGFANCLVVAPTPLNSDTIGLTFAQDGSSVSFPYLIPVESLWLITFSFSCVSAGAAAAYAPVPNFANGLANVKVLNPINTFYAVSTPNPNPGAATVRSQDWVGFIQYTGGASLTTPPSISLANVTTMFSSYGTCLMYVTMVNNAAFLST